MPKSEDAIIEEFRALRQELLGVQTARLWGTLTYIVLASGVATLETRSNQPWMYLFLIMMALPFLWHIANRERSRVRIAAYIKVVIEEQIPGLGWEAHLSEYRRLAMKRTILKRTVDCWRYVFALTGVYVIIVLCSLILFWRHRAFGCSKSAVFRVWFFALSHIYT